MKRQKRQEKPIRQSEKPIRHATGREQAGGRASVQRYQLPRGIVDESHLTGKLRGELSHALTEAAVVRASKEVWDRAAAITADGKFLAERIAGAIERFQLGEDITDDLDLIIDTRETLALDPDDPEQFASIRQNAAMLEDVVGRLDSANDELWFSSIKKTADEIESVVAVLNLAADAPEQFSSIRQTAGEIESIVTLLEGTPDAAGQFSSIRQTHQEITRVVAMLESDPDDPNQYSAIRQIVDEIDLRVKAEDIISAINLSPEGVRIEGKRLEIDSDTIIAKGAIHAEALNIGRIPSSLPQGAHLFHFDNSLNSTGGLRPLPGHVATLRPGEGRFGGAVAVEEGTTNLCEGLGGSNYDINKVWSGDRDKITIVDVGGKKWMKREPGSGSLRIASTPVSPSTHYTWSFLVFADRNTSGSVLAYDGGFYSTAYFNISQKPRRVYATFETREGSTYDIPHIRIDSDSSVVYFADFQLEQKPFPTSFVDGTRAGGRLMYPGAIPSNEGTLLIWAKKNTLEPNTRDRFRKILDAQLPRIDFQWTESGNLSANFGGASLSIPDPAQDLDWHQYAITYSGRTVKMYFDGQLVASGQAQEDLVNFSELCVGARWDGRGAGNALYDELLILPYAASPDEIRAWCELDAPFYDAAASQSYLLPDGHEITLDRTGLTMTPAGFDEPGMKATGYMLGFWDKNNVPSIGLGDVREMASQLGSDMEYGIFIAQGEIRASQSVLESSLTDFGVTRDKLGPGSVDRGKLSPGAVSGEQVEDKSLTITKLGEQIHVPMLDTFGIERVSRTNVVTRTSWSVGTWYNIDSFTFSKRDASKGLFAEAVRIHCHVKAPVNGPIAAEMQIRMMVNGTQRALWGEGTFTSGGQERYFSVTMDVRSLPESITIAWQWSLNSNLSWETRSDSRLVYQNDQLPLRAGYPQYSLLGETPVGCFTGCQVTCEGTCEHSCQTNEQKGCTGKCELSCQSDCESSCQATCESTSQGGGGCLRDGTPVTIWDEDEQVYREIPVEDLKPGMILPGYNPETDTLEHGELLELVDARFSNRFLRIHTDIGPSVDVTYSQPFDVLADMGDGWKWYAIQSKFLQPGMKMVRPFDAQERRMATVTQVEHVKEQMVQFWDPKTTSGRYVAAGYADWIVK